MPQQLVEKDACELLDADHIAVKHLFVEYARLAYAGDPEAAREQLARTICRELTVHAAIEEEIFYPALRDATDAGELLDAAEAEHQQAKELIAEVEGLAQADATMDERVAALARTIELHVKGERDHLFPKARAAAGLDLQALGAQLRARQDDLQALGA